MLAEEAIMNSEQKEPLPLVLMKWTRPYAERR